MSSTTTIAAVLRNASQCISEHSGSDTSRLDAEILLAEVLRCERSYFFTWPEKTVSEADRQAFEGMVQRRCQGEPIAYIVGYRDFWSLRLQVAPDTLIPRPDTETLVEQALLRLPLQAFCGADLGTGTGAIALALASERVDSYWLALDKQWPAAGLAQRNRIANAIPNVAVLCADWANCIAADSLDVLVSNPPYIDADDPHLEQGDVRFEPRSALVAGQQGLADIAKIVSQAVVCLKPSGLLMFEHGWQQAEQVQEILRAAGFGGIETLLDLAGQPRVTLGYKEAGI
jgi:release factor glutamine methyltransferase